MAHSCKKETEILADAMVSASISLDDMATALRTLGCQGLKTADAVSNLASALGAYPSPPFICPKHGIIEANEILYNRWVKGRRRNPPDWGRYCGHCWREDKKWTRVYKWSDQLTGEDFEISPHGSKN